MQKYLCFKYVVPATIVVLFCYCCFCARDDKQKSEPFGIKNANTPQTKQSGKIGCSKLVPDHMNFAMNKCDVNCCATQSKVPWGPVGKVDGSQYVKNQYTCVDIDQNAGCLCMTKDQHKFLETRGQSGNTVKWDAECKIDDEAEE